MRTTAFIEDPTHKTWRSMIYRCNRVGSHYHKRGIKVHPSWESFEQFLADVGPRPSPKHSIDRIDNDGDYEPGNVRWATSVTQNRNKSDNVELSFQGRTMCLAAWADALGITKQALSGRLRKGWPLERALSEPRRDRKTTCVRGHALTEDNVTRNRRGSRHCKKCQSIRSQRHGR